MKGFFFKHYKVKVVITDQATKDLL